MATPAPKLRSLVRRPLLVQLAMIVALLVALAVAAHLLLLLLTRHGAHRIVPDLSGIQLRDAERLAAAEKLRLVINDSLYVPSYDGGIVLDQLPQQGVEVKPGRTIYVTINAFSQRMVDVPYVAGRSLRQARNMLETAGLEIDKLVYSEDMATNYVLEQRVEGRTVSPDSRLRAPAGSGVTLVVGVDRTTSRTVVPQIVGTSLREARNRIWENGLNVGGVHFDEGIDALEQKQARVYRQSPALGSSALFGARVDLFLTLDSELAARNAAEAEKLARELLEQRREEEAAAADSLARIRIYEALTARDTTAAAADTPPVDSPDEFFD